MGVIGGPDPIVTNGLIVYYDPGNVQSFNLGVATVTDLMGNNNATSYGTISSSFGDKNGFNTNSANNYIQIAGASAGPLYDRGTGDVTVEVWAANTGDSSNYQWIMSNWNSSQGIHMGVLTGTNFGTYFGSSGEVNSSFSIPADGTWHHYVMYRDGSTVYFYVDGESKGNFSNSSTLSSTTNTRMGSRGNNTAQSWQGTIGPTKIYNRALTAAEILQNYNAHKDRFE